MFHHLNWGKRYSTRRTLLTCCHPSIAGYINFYSNQLTGTIPSFLRWRRLFFLDLGRNQLIGTIPEDMERFVGLRHLHLDHNQFKGSLPETFPEIGNGQLETISINDNQFTGQIPGKFEFIDKLGKHFWIEITNFVHHLTM